jgi:hypothetical protein
MRIEIVEKLSDANIQLQPYYILIGVIHNSKNKQIKDVFVGILDEGISHAIYLSKLDIYPPHEFNRYDLDNLQLWAAFTDNSVTPIADLYDDEDIVALIKKGTLFQNIAIFDNEWTEVIKIPRGLSVIIKPTGLGDLELEIKDFPDGIARKVTINEFENRDMFNIGYYDYLKGMKNPTFRMRLSENDGIQAEISIEFVDR